jgi:urea carboxylase
MDLGKGTGFNSCQPTGKIQPASEALAFVIPEGPAQPKVIGRLAGDAYLLVEYGEMIFDLNIRIRVHSLEEALNGMHIEGLLETIPGVRSLLIKYDGLRLSLDRLINTLKSAERNLPSIEEMEVSSRVVHLPIAFHDRWTRQAIAEYMQTVRAEAPYLPDNMAFVARCNGLENVDQVAEYLQTSQLLVLGLGDVYLGAPCAVSLDPRNRLVAPKYNPARTFTPEGAVGIGGTCICIYPMESPGGYQLIGRTLPIWNTWQTTPPFAEAPWLLRCFDRIQFEPVGEVKLEEARRAMLAGDYPLRIEDGTFSVKEYNQFIDSIRNEVEAFRIRQNEAARRCLTGY